ncbi:MAG: hypothetical protein QE487_06730 [Fluviicola sp.]|nr:hypothetical protein [Fluviicola sp.]
MSELAGPTQKTIETINAIEIALKGDKIDIFPPQFDRWKIGYSDSPQIKTGKSRFFYYELENKVQTMIVISTLKEKGMQEERYSISSENNVKYIMIYHD